MHRTQILLEDWQYHALKASAEREKRSISALLRRLLSEVLGRRRNRAAGLDELDGLASDPLTSGRDHDLYLYGARK